MTTKYKIPQSLKKPNQLGEKYFFIKFNYSPIFPGFRIFFGSKACFNERNSAIPSGVKAIFINGALGSPMPCLLFSVLSKLLYLFFVPFVALIEIH